ncbi:hypothetical protein ABZP36_003333 [Zizania latifolia]
MDSAAPLLSPTSDDRFWGHLRTRVDTILEDRLLAAPAAMCGVESERGKRLREDSLMLVRGLDSVAASLAQLSDTLTAAQKGVNAVAMFSSGDEGAEPQAKRHCGLAETASLDDDTPVAGANSGEGSEKELATDAKLRQDNGDMPASSAVAKSTNLKRARNLAVLMAGRASALASDLKNIKSELHFMQERCGLLEAENKRLREGHDNGVPPEEDDLVRLQLEALLAEKSRLAQENANLSRENQSLIQLVEYHQLTSQDLAASYEDVMHGMRLDFSSPLGKIDSDEEEECECEDRVLAIPTDELELLGSSDE